MVKRILSVLLSVMLLASIMVPAISVSANVEVVDIADYTPNLDDDLITSGPNGSEQKAGITSKNLSGKIWTMTATDEQLVNSLKPSFNTTSNSLIISAVKIMLKLEETLDEKEIFLAIISASFLIP